MTILTFLGYGINLESFADLVEDVPHVCRHLGALNTIKNRMHLQKKVALIDDSDVCFWIRLDHSLLRCIDS